jgi:hypothetical protein
LTDDQLGDERARRNRQHAHDPRAREAAVGEVQAEWGRRQALAAVDPLSAVRHLSDVELTGRRDRLSHQVAHRPDDRAQLELDTIEAEIGRRAVAATRPEAVERYQRQVKATEPVKLDPTLADLRPAEPIKPVTVRREMVADYEGRSVLLLPGCRIDAARLDLPGGRLEQLLNQHWFVEDSDPAVVHLHTAAPTPQANEADRQRAMARERTRKSRARRRMVEAEEPTDA